MTEQEIKEKRAEIRVAIEQVILEHERDIYTASGEGALVHITSKNVELMMSKLSSLGVVIADQDAELQTIQDELCTAYYEDDPRRMEKALGKLAGYTKTYPLEEK